MYSTPPARETKVAKGAFGAVSWTALASPSWVLLAPPLLLPRSSKTSLCVVQPSGVHLSGLVLSAIPESTRYAVPPGAPAVLPLSSCSSCVEVIRGEAALVAMLDAEDSKIGDGPFCCCWDAVARTDTNASERADDDPIRDGFALHKEDARGRTCSVI